MLLRTVSNSLSLRALDGTLGGEWERERRNTLQIG